MLSIRTYEPVVCEPQMTIFNWSFAPIENISMGIFSLFNHISAIISCKCVSLTHRYICLLLLFIHDFPFSNVSNQFVLYLYDFQVCVWTMFTKHIDAERSPNSGSNHQISLVLFVSLQKNISLLLQNFCEILSKKNIFRYKTCML